MAFQNLQAWRREAENEIAVAFGETLRGGKREVGGALLRELIFLTPVDTGDLRSGWHTSSGSPTGQQDPAGEPFVALVQQVAGAEPGETLYFQNNKPHAPVIEFGLFEPPNPGPSRDPRPGRFGSVLVQDGYSTQAPRGITGDALESVASRFGLETI